jgi:ribosomal-protein-alanine N-acetyltransferase
VPAVFAASSDPRLTEFTLFDTHRTPADTEAFVIGYALPSYAAGKPDPFGITWKDTPDEVIGCCGVFPVLDEPDLHEVGYWVRVADWGQGVATEAVGELMRFVFAEGVCKRVRARVFVGNAASEAVLRKLGFARQPGVMPITCRGKMEEVTVFTLAAR